ncbi:MAG: sugar ABC transporter permease, partial [Lachnospiraceae bacterium]|nr:sugar ABC transporter permease [Lachnospiraceae bacterium]
MKKKKRKLSLSTKRMIMGYIFIMPWFVGFAIFYVRSIILTGQFSLSKLTVDANVGGYSLEYVGLKNFVYAFREHGSFKQILTTSVGNMLIDVPLITFFSLFMAMLLNKKFPGRAVFRAIFFLPVILNSGAIAAMMDLAETMMNGGISATTAEVSGGTSELAFN